MKKILCLFLVCIFSLSLVSCSDDENNESNPYDSVFDSVVKSYLNLLKDQKTGSYSSSFNEYYNNMYLLKYNTDYSYDEVYSKNLLNKYDDEYETWDSTDVKVETRIKQSKEVNLDMQDEVFKKYAKYYDFKFDKKGVEDIVALDASVYFDGEEHNFSDVIFAVKKNGQWTILARINLGYYLFDSYYNYVRDYEYFPDTTESDTYKFTDYVNVLFTVVESYPDYEMPYNKCTMAITLDTNHDKIKLTSFNEDTLVDIKDNDYIDWDSDDAKIAFLYPSGKENAIISTAYSNFDLFIDRYVTLDLEYLPKIIDELGGADLNLTYDDIDYINYMKYKTGLTTDTESIKSEAGKVHLNGEETKLHFLNAGLEKGVDGNEIGIDGDKFDRMRRQQDVAEFIIKKLQGMSNDEIRNFYAHIGTMLRTNFKIDEWLILISNSDKYSKYSVKKYSVPQDGLWELYDSPENGYVDRITDLDKCKEGLRNFIYEGVSADDYSVFISNHRPSYKDNTMTDDDWKTVIDQLDKRNKENTDTTDNVVDFSDFHKSVQTETLTKEDFFPE